MFSIKNGTELKQWSTGNLLTNPHMNAGDTVRFVDGSGMVKKSQAYNLDGEIVVDVPNHVLTTSHAVRAELIGHPECATTFRVKNQPKPDDYVLIDNRKKFSENVGGASVQPDWNQNDPNATDFVKNRTHYTELMYSDTYIDYFDVSPIKAGMGLFPLVTAKEGKESFDFKAFFDPDFLQRAYTTSGRRMKFAINNILKNSALNTSSTMNSASAFLNNRTFIDDKNFMVAINPTNGFDIYAICDTSTLTDSYKDMFAKKGVYLHITKEPTVNSGYYFDSVSFKVLEYVPIDEGYIPLNVPRVDSKAAVGQTVVVKSVNSAGQPREWETANLPDVGGGGSGGIGFDLVVHIDYSGEKWAEGNFEKARSICLNQTSFPLIACVEFVGDGFSSAIVSNASASPIEEYIEIQGASGKYYYVFPNLTVTVRPY